MNLLKSSVSKILQNKLYLSVAVIFVVIILVGGSYLILGNFGKKSSQESSKVATGSSQAKSNSNSNRPDSGDANSTNPVEKGKALASGNCIGEGSKKLGSAPMKVADINYIEPYGLLAGGHVTPIDHQYYWAKHNTPDANDVLALADGKIVGISYRPHDPVNYPNSKIKGDYRVVIMYSCTFFSYFDLATSLSADIESQTPSGWESAQNKVITTDISVKEGQTIAKMGGQSLDFAIWDTTKTDKGLLVPTAYNNAEAWKINTVKPLDYFTTAVKNEILPLYIRKADPVDGVIGQDVDGTAAGNWFLTGTNGYAGVFSYGSQGGGQNGYWDGHLALVHDLFDPTGWVFSIGNLNGQAVQYAISNPSIAPDKITTSSGLIKYEFGQWEHIDSSGQMWNGQAFPISSLTMKAGFTKGTVLVQLTAKRELKVEVFLNKASSQVSGFTSSAKTYDRGDNAKMIQSNTAT